MNMFQLHFQCVDFLLCNLPFKAFAGVPAQVNGGPVRATGSIHIGGVVEAGSIVEAGGDLVVAKGILGDGTTFVHSSWVWSSLISVFLPLGRGTAFPPLAEISSSSTVRPGSPSVGLIRRHISCPFSTLG